MATSLTTDPATGIALCARGLHPMTPDNRWKGSDRCIECKRANDRVLYESKKAAKAGITLTDAEIEDIRSKSEQTAAAAARAKVAGASRATRAGAVPVTRAAATAVMDPPVTSGPEPTVLDEPVVIRSRGYRQRQLAGLPDVAALQRARAAKLCVMLYGPPGAGKTELVRTAFEDAITLHGDGDTLVDDFVGAWTPTGSADEYVWIDGPLVQAMRQGRPFFIDDATLIPPKVLAVVYPVMDGRGVVQVKGHPVQDDEGRWGPDIVSAQEGFFVVGGHNPHVHGAIFPEALASRFAMHVHVTTNYAIARSMGLDKNVVKLAENMTTMQKDGTVRWAPQMRELLNFQALADNLGPETALANLVGICPDEDRKNLTEQARSIWGTEPVALALGGAVKS
jgi:nitric oxide reductase NorQ protein